VTTEIPPGPAGASGQEEPAPSPADDAPPPSPGDPPQPSPRPDNRSRLRRLGPDTRPLSVPAYRRLFFGQVTTVIGAMLTTVAVQQQIFDITGSSAWVGIASLVALVPLVVFGLLGGAIADTYDRRKLLMVTSVGIALTSIGLWIAALIGSESVWVVLALLAVQQGFFAVNQPTRSAIVPRIVPVDMVPAANALSMTVFSLGVIVGPLLVGVLIPLVGLPWLYFIDALTLVAILYAVMKLPPIPPLGERRGRAKVLDGINYLRLQPLLLMTFVVDIIAMVFGMPRALFPQMAQETFGGPPGGGLALGMLNAGLAIGSLLGGLTGGWIHRIYRQGVAIIAAILVWGLSMALFGTTSVLWLAVLYLAIGGWSDLVSAVYRSTILQVRATDEMRGRMQGVFTVVVAGGPRVADLVHGVVADATSTAFAVTAGGIATMVLTIVAALLGRSLWNYDSRRRDPSVL
jgi:MFS family permease